MEKSMQWQKVNTGFKYGTFLLAAFAVLEEYWLAAGENVSVSKPACDGGGTAYLLCRHSRTKKHCSFFGSAWGKC